MSSTSDDLEPQLTNIKDMGNKQSLFEKGITGNSDSHLDNKMAVTYCTATLYPRGWNRQEEGLQSGPGQGLQSGQEEGLQSGPGQSLQSGSEQGLQSGQHGIVIAGTFWSRQETLFWSRLETFWSRLETF